MPRTPTRLAVGTLVLALPLAAAAGCGVEKKRTIKAEFASASSNLSNSKAASFTLRLNDSKGNVGKLMTKDDGAPKAIADAFLGGSVTYTVDPASNKTLKDLKVSGASSKDLSTRLKDVNLAFVVRDDKAALAEIRLVAGTLYAHVDLAEVGRLAKAGGVKDFDAQLDEALTSGDPALSRGLTEVRNGKWIKLPLADYLDRLQHLAGSFSQNLTGGTETPKIDAKNYDFNQLGEKLFAAVKPYVKVTDANDSSSDRVLDVKVKVRPALKAALTLLQGSKDLPFAGLLKSIEPSVIDTNVKDGTAGGTITLKSGHLTQFAVDIESIRTLATDPGTDSVAGTSVVFDVDDSADEVTVPSNVSSFDIGVLLDQLLEGFSAGGSTSLTGVAG